MSRHTRLPYAVVATGFAIACIAAMPSAGACSITDDYVWPTIEERTSAADYVIIGRVEEVSPRAARPTEMGFWDIVLYAVRGRIARVSVDEWLKGNGPDTVSVTGFGGGGDCRSTVPDGSAIMFLVGDASGGPLLVNDVGVYDAVIDNTAESAERIRTAVGE